MKKRIIALLLCLLMLPLCACREKEGSGENARPAETAVPAPAVTGYKANGDFAYTSYSDGTAVITKYAGNDTDLTVPAELDGYRVTGIGAAAFSRRYCLKSVVIPEGVISIGDDAFDSCRFLTSVTLPDSVTEVGCNPFIDCDSLESICVSDDHPVLTFRDGALFDKKQKRLISLPGTCLLDEYTVPDGTEIIGDYAFYDCSLLQSVRLPDGVSSIGAGAFPISLQHITIPDSVTDIDDSAYGNYYGYYYYVTAEVGRGSCAERYILERGSGVAPTMYETYTLEYAGCMGSAVCGNWEYDYFTDGTAMLRKYTGDETEVTVPAELDGYRVNAIGAYVFSARQETETTEVQSIRGRNTVSTTVTVYPSVTSLTIPDGVEYISGYAFSHCRDLVSVRIPDSVTSVGPGAFAGCVNLTDITLSADHPLLGLKDGRLYEKDSMKLIFDQPAYGKAEYTVPEGYRIIGESLYEGCGFESVTIPAGVTEIGDRAFYHCEIGAVSIPEGVQSIGCMAFGSASLTSVSIPGSVKNIGDYAFYNNMHMENVVLGAGVEIIGSYAFINCNMLTSVRIPNSVKRIRMNAFSGSFTSVDLPDNGVTIEWSALCSSSLTTCYVPDSVVLWSSAFTTADTEKLPRVIIGRTPYLEYYCKDYYAFTFVPAE